MGKIKWNRIFLIFRNNFKLLLGFLGASNKIDAALFDSFCGCGGFSPLSIIMSVQNKSCWSKYSSSQVTASRFLWLFYSVDDVGSGQPSFKKISTKWFRINPRHMMGVFCLAGGGSLSGKKDSDFPISWFVNKTTHLL